MRDLDSIKGSSERVVLGIKEICEKLSLSRSSFERLRKGTLLATINNKVVPFPVPLALGLTSHPKWSVEDLNQWINQA